MSKFKKGETSDEVLDKKSAITKSMEKKAELLDKINTYEDIADSLKLKTDYISEAAVYKWSDSQLEVISCCGNTAHKDHNKHALNTLLESIKNANQRLAGESRIDSEKSVQKTTRLSEGAVNDLKVENEQLQIALAEVYRAYLQILDNYREDKQVDDALRQLIKDQARVLGKNRIWEVKNVNCNNSKET